MKLTLNIETSDPNDLVRVASALAGTGAVVQVTAPEPTKAKREAKPEPVAAPPAAQPTSFASPAPEQPAQPAATAEVTDEDLVQAANNAAIKLGGGGQARMREYIKANFLQEDGSPGTMMKTKKSQRPALLFALQQMSRGELTP